MEKRIIKISEEKFREIDFTRFKCVVKHLTCHHDVSILALMEMPYTERKDVQSGVYYKDGFTVEVVNFRGRASVVCRELYPAQCEKYEQYSTNGAINS